MSKQPMMTREKPLKLLLGFCRGQGVNPEDVSRKIIKDVEYIYVEKTNTRC